MSRQNGLNLPTMKDIAELARVSRATASLVLNGRGDDLGVRSDTQQRIRDAARQLRYKPNTMAAGLRGGKTKSIGLLWSLGGPHDGEGMARRIARQFSEHAYVTYLADHMGLWRATIQALEDFARRGVDGIVIQAGGNLFDNDAVRRLLAGFPAVVVSCSSVSELYGCMVDHVIHDRGQAFRDAAEHFFRTGRRKPALLTGSIIANQPKVDAYVARLEELGVPASAIRLLEAPPSTPGVLDAYWADDITHGLNEMFPGRPDFDALQCTNDETAIAAIAWLSRRGLCVPEDVAVCGFNDSEFARFVQPPLATVVRQDAETARLIDQFMFHRLENPEQPLQAGRVEMRFQWRASAGGTASAVAR
ncbi:MAG: LacI family DNA-binding transcriptional regulator [Phycisphaeraceae bacterium]|nr:LacI family DNA-binding transcriptional regulator [Phycisphaeraceae bacterium]